MLGRKFDGGYLQRVPKTPKPQKPLLCKKCGFFESRIHLKELKKMHFCSFLSLYLLLRLLATVCSDYMISCYNVIPDILDAFMTFSRILEIFCLSVRVVILGRGLSRMLDFVRSKV